MHSRHQFSTKTKPEIFGDLKYSRDLKLKLNKTFTVPFFQTTDPEKNFLLLETWGFISHQRISS